MKWHTKHVHCTMECGGNNGLFQGPCFETCKAGVDLTRLGVGAVAPGGSGWLTGAQTTSGPSVATNYSTVDPGADEECDLSSNGYVIPPTDLLDWTSTDAPFFRESITGYHPPVPSALPPNNLLGRQPTPDLYSANALQMIDAPVSASVIVAGVPVGSVPVSLNIGANEGRLRSDLRLAAQRANPLESLCKAAVAFALGNASDGNAFADLSVTGRRSYAAFRKRPPEEAGVLACLQRDPSTQVLTIEARQQATDAALGRAYRVLNLVRAGGWPVACPERAALRPQYIAVSGEDDQPHRPVNVPSAEFPQYDLNVSVPRPNGQPPLVVHTRYMIAHTVVPLGAERARCPVNRIPDRGDVSRLRTIPADRAPVLAPDAEVILYIHGMDSNLEEAMDLTHALHALGRQQGKNYTVISMDLPTSGYADNIDHTTIAPLTDNGHAEGLEWIAFSPNGYTAPLVDFDENFIVSFVNTLDQLVPVTRRLRAIVGGSLGGNMAMRLGRPRADAPWVTNVVPWSPAAIWPSFADNGIKHVALSVPWQLAGGLPSYLPEDAGARRSFFYGKFDWQSKVFGIGVGGGRPQAEYWYSDRWRCKNAHLHLARVHDYETYNQNFRLWHWRLGLEQLQFSHQIHKAGTNLPLYLFNTKRTLLMCGMDDTGGSLCDHTRAVAAKMEYTPGFALFLSKTGHSIHNERPNFLARKIVDFVGP
ncbi:MAG: hypothetical protein AUI08_07385 [Gemmatimonadetes bacterium 13_2_20CM_2_65_7]|nr:MAG: hypothetical protein AUI08_07385 [Gemmatimonadetes bacterium 13_2_20CM_2_65_7]OLD00656.1 MAG: hypothetical protein AUI89_06230 [Gemmatimonadetes bacterium 13_1_40CM_3_65_8]